ncbi:MAG: bifunctional hydroxymethylpyrimidine kinase/phosphomethylpyrimidine kinase [Puniceicoccaceae bacterium]|nr:MAG: bifunctional hydroxymethylpyrimidine kinase/phosphomethylpyrimidine kinase [Puniceicoccaceae bacterium]
MPVALTVAGSDSGGGAGIQADLLSFAANGVFGTTALTCLTAQNPEGVSGIVALEPDFVAEQIRQVRRFFAPAAAKTGMLFNAGIIEAVADALGGEPAFPVVVDPVMVATSGAVLLDPAAIDALKAILLPRAAVVTPNLDEAAILLGEAPSCLQMVHGAAVELAGRYGVPFLLKGGHLDGAVVEDVLAQPDGTVRIFTAERVHGVDTHGSGCTLAAALAAGLACGLDLEKAVERAQAYLLAGLRNPLAVGGRRYIRH